MCLTNHDFFTSLGGEKASTGATGANDVALDCYGQVRSLTPARTSLFALTRFIIAYSTLTYAPFVSQVNLTMAVTLTNMSTCIPRIGTFNK